ncbi:MAG: alanine racemase, partial [Pseudomonadota bacterium]
EGAEKCVRAAEDLNSAAVLDFTIEIDVDGYRTGLREKADDLVKIAFILADSEATRFVGIMSYAGASYGKTPEEARSFAAEHVDALKNSKGILEKEGYACDFVSIGSTPAVLHADNLEGVTEARCGIYAFQDLFQAGIGAATVDDIAVSVVADVIARQPHYNRFVIDAGGLALSKDRSTAGKPFDAQYGLVCDAETGSPLGDLAVVSVSQEIGLVSSLSGASVDLDAFPIGRRIRILPNHADMTAAAYEQYHVVEGDANIIDVWTRQNHWT